MQNMELYSMESEGNKFVAQRELSGLEVKFGSLKKCTSSLTQPINSTNSHYDRFEMIFNSIS